MKRNGYYEVKKIIKIEWLGKYNQEANEILRQIFYDACQPIPAQGFNAMKSSLSNILQKRDGLLRLEIESRNES